MHLAALVVDWRRQTEWQKISVKASYAGFSFGKLRSWTELGNVFKSRKIPHRTCCVKETAWMVYVWEKDELYETSSAWARRGNEWVSLSTNLVTDGWEETRLRKWLLVTLRDWWSRLETSTRSRHTFYLNVSEKLEAAFYNYPDVLGYDRSLIKYSRFS